MRRRFIRALLCLCALAAPFKPAAGAQLRVFAAASLSDALAEISSSYGRATGEQVILNLSASSTLARQIEAGAPADLFLSADEQGMDRLEQQNLLLPGTRRSVLSNSLVVVVPLDSGLRISGPADLAALPAVALAEPKTVPAGIYARRYLQERGLWGRIASRVIPTENVRAALAAVESGNVEAGIVYRTDAGISSKVRIAYEIPRAEAADISYPFAVLAASERRDAARKLLAYLHSPAALAVFRKHGFLILD